MRVKEVMSQDPAICTPDTSLPEVARLMVDHDCGCIPVVNDLNERKPVGVITDRDITCRVVAQNENPQEKRVSDCMTNTCVTTTPDASVEECCEALEHNQIRRVVVLDEQGHCCGMVAQADIARRADDHQTHEVLREVSQPT